MPKAENKPCVLLKNSKTYGRSTQCCEFSTIFKSSGLSISSTKAGPNQHLLGDRYFCDNWHKIANCSMEIYFHEHILTRSFFTDLHNSFRRTLEHIRAVGNYTGQVFSQQTHTIYDASSESTYKSLLKQTNRIKYKLEN